MQTEEYYKFQPKDFNQHGFHVETQQWFMDLIKEFEEEFHKKFPHCFANYLFANNATMMRINQAMDLDSDESSGMDLIDGEVNLETNLEIEKYSEIKTIYAIGSKIKENEDEPIFLVLNNKIADGLILLKYIPDSESEDIETPIPVNERDLIKID